MSKPNWDEAPDWANWLAMDFDGAWYWYQVGPNFDEGTQVWWTDLKYRNHFSHIDMMARGNPRDTLEQRTQQTKEEDNMTTLDPDAIYFQVPVETEADMTVALLNKQLEAVESGLQDLLDKENPQECRGQDMVDFVRVRDALVEVINFNSMYEDQISKEWQQK